MRQGCAVTKLRMKTEYAQDFKSKKVKKSMLTSDAALKISSIIIRASTRKDGRLG